jgi:hypothetical protein
MKTLKTVVIVLALLFIVVAAAEAVDLYTAPLLVTGADVFYCNIVNVGTTNKTVRIRVMNVDGGTIMDTGEFVLDPGQVLAFPADTNSLGGFGYCRFTVSGAKTGVRAAAKIFLSGGDSDKVAIAAE